jgi:hypothetical protein
VLPAVNNLTNTQASSREYEFTANKIYPEKELALGLLSCFSLSEWERKFKPYKFA